MQYSYDNNGIYFYYFLLSFLGLYLFPLTYSYAQKLTSSSSSKNKQRHSDEDRIWSEQQVKKLEWQRSQLKRTWRQPRLSKRFISWIIGWIVFIWLAYIVWTTPIEESKVAFDPYSILELDSGATVEEIKKKFKRLSLKWHPDKNQNNTEAQDRFIQISKAYKALTDDDVRKNWEEYGDPDGRQSFSYGIALPEWIVRAENSTLVLGFYAMVFGILLPVVVGKWWAGSKQYTKDRVLTQTMALFFNELKESTNVKKMMELVCAAVENRDNVPWRGQRDMDAVNQLFFRVREKVLAKTGDRLELPKKYAAPYVFKAFVLFYAHLFRVPVEDELLVADSRIILQQLLHLSMRGLLTIASAQFWLSQSIGSLELSRMILQAVPLVYQHTESSELYQLPYLEAEHIKALQNKKKVKSVYQFLAIPSAERQSLLKDMGLNDRQIQCLTSVAEHIPRISIEDAYFECSGEKMITPGSLITFVLVLKAVTYKDNLPYDKPVASSPVESSKTETKNEKQPAETVTSPKPAAAGDDDDSDDEDFYLGDDEGGSTKASQLTKLLSGYYWNNPNEPVHCPHFPQSAFEDPIRPTYYMWLCNPRNNRVVGAPTVIRQLIPAEASTLELIDVLKERRNSGNDKRNKSQPTSPTSPTGAGNKSGRKPGTKKIKFKFQAPTQAGTFGFTCLVQSDAYCGITCAQDVKLVVHPFVETEEKQREKMEEEAWRDYEEDLVNEPSVGLMAPPVAADDSSSDSSSESGSDSSGDESD